MRGHVRPRRTSLEHEPEPAVDAIVAVAELVRRQIEAEEAAREGRYREAHQVMVLFQEAVVGRGHHAVGAAAGKLADRLGSADAFGASTAYRSSMRKGGTRGVTSLYQSDAEEDLRSMGRAVKTAAQDRMEEAFGAKRPDAAPGAKDDDAGSGPGAARRGSGRRTLDRRRSRRW